jgi:hypothetical protein
MFKVPGPALTITPGPGRERLKKSRSSPIGQELTADSANTLGRRFDSPEYS